ncbi:hypothetical protein [Actinospica sp.]|jgi:hypothetical protein|uniref:hypothetical protein n=1 Tax=Actinospica sp. TaxID=1872142 RepID=UPI002C672C50|nr:hypothetical protein [Actinospica sp.]HWG25904.1 hypothetical protein [Actinospica sp.]
MSDLDLAKYEWVRREGNSISDVFARVRFIRAGSAPNPAEAIRILQALALLRRTDDLLELEPEPDQAGSENLDRLDALAVLAFAALTRPVAEAAQLAIGRWRKEKPNPEDPDPKPARLTDGIVHDVIAQRTVPEVAVFITVCRAAEGADRAPDASLVHKALTAFAGPSSGRTSLDKAMLYIGLNDGGDPDAAAFLLENALQQAAANAPLRDNPAAVERDGIVRALNHVSPSERIVESWIDRRLLVRRDEPAVLQLAASLLVGEPTGAESLAAHAGRNWSERLLCQLCEILVRRSERCFASVRRHAASRGSDESLHKIILTWQKSVTLNPSLPRLLADVVADGANGATGPRDIAFLRNLHEILDDPDVPRECRTRLRVAMAEHVKGRTGTEVAQLLGEVDGPDLRRTAQVVNERLSALLHEGEIEGADFAEYLKGLQEVGRAPSLTFWAVRERADPKQGDAPSAQTAAAVLGDIAAQMYAAGQPAIAIDLLERSLENEQAVTPAYATAIVRRVRQDPALPADERWKALLGATVGRWADERSRDDVVDALRAHGFDTEGDAVVNSVQ